MIGVSSTPVAGVTNVEIEIADKDIFKQERKDVFDLHWKLQILHGNFRFLKKTYFFDSHNNNIKKVNFTMSQKGCDTATIDFDYVDVFIQPEDIVILSALDRIVYQGRVSNIEGNKVEVRPARAKLSELLYYGTFNKNYSALEIIKTVLDEKNIDSGVSFNEAYIDNDFYNKMAVYYLPAELKIEYKTVNDVIEDLITEIDSDAIWGVNEQGIFFVKYPEKTVSQYFYQAEKRSDYEKITVSENWDALEFTRAAVTRAGRKYSDEEKEADSSLVDEDDTVFCGVVGYESTPDYPVLSDFENLVGKKETLIHVSTMLTSDTVRERNEIALSYAYTMLKSQSTEKQVKLTKVPFRPELLPSQMAYVQTTDNSFLTLSDCQTLQNWERGWISETVSVFGDRHILADQHTTFYLDRDTQFREQKFLVFYAKFPCADIFRVEFRSYWGTVLFSRKYQITDRGWQQITIPYTKSFCSVKFIFPSKFELDMLQVYCLNDKVYNVNVNKITTEIKNGIALSSVELGSQNVTANDQLHYLQWKFKQLDAINSI